jgi:hypothetical protein
MRTRGLGYAFVSCAAIALFAGCGASSTALPQPGQQSTSFDTERLTNSGYKILYTF